MLVTRRRMLGLSAATMGALALAACNGNGGEASNGGEAASDHAGTLVASTSGLEGKFCPLFTASAADQDVVSFNNIALLATDRMAEPIYNGIEGETKEYNGTEYTYTGPANIEMVENADGTVNYNIQLRDDLKFHDGSNMTVDDIIFTFYSYFDPTYDGSATLYSNDIQGLAEYRSGMATLASLIGNAGRENTDFTYFTQEQQDAFWAAVDDGGTKFAQEIVDYVNDPANGVVEEGSDPLSVADAAANWGYSDLPADATATTFFEAIAANYDWNFSLMEAETAGTALSELIPEDVYNMGTQGVETGEAAPNVAGIVKVDDYNMSVVTNGVDATMIYQLSIAPCSMKYYGDESLYDYENNSFGFNKGDLSKARGLNGQPMGSGAFKFDDYTSGTVHMSANEEYYKGAPKTQHLNLVESQEADMVTGVQAGTLDISQPSYSMEVEGQIKEINGNDSVNGDVITTFLHDYRGYGYLAISANKVNVAGDPASDASKALRKAICTLISPFRASGIASYYGDTASVLNYPISTSSWASPNETDPGYAECYSTDASGNPLYTQGMSDDERIEAAKAGALTWFEAAGYTVADGMLTAAPEGAKLEYQCNIGGGGQGDHPTFMILQEAKNAFSEIGMNFIVNDIANASDLFASYQSGEAEMWCAAWQSTADPDMYQLYHSQGSTNYYCINDADLDELIEAGRQTLETESRKAIYKEAMDIILDWGVELPVYQRSECTLVSSERVNIDSVVQDQTPYWTWKDEIEKLELK
ncbi:ABC transporter substrate-binding protein [Olsenella uli]|uniref:ABC transporter substrate-binding protein n=1 Tax=Olsenella uli TaxID=133926 RepID=UPI00195EE080|nr:ABC transporter substrate-binding protein [Olsenella uli]MBM6815932.1 ABC transporter substrate-binding protein [Olsenella uli]